MFQLVSVRHVGVHQDELQHGVSIQSYINLGKTFPRISRIRIIPWTQILARVFVYLLPFISQILDFICGIMGLWFLFWSILNGVTLLPISKFTVIITASLQNSFCSYYLRFFLAVPLCKILQSLRAFKSVHRCNLLIFHSSSPFARWHVKTGSPLSFPVCSNKVSSRFWGLF